jgi:hypothetical protein
MTVDVLTKPFANDRHQTLTRAMGLKTFDYLQSGSLKGRLFIVNRNIMGEA